MYKLMTDVMCVVNLHVFISIITIIMTWPMSTNLFLFIIALRQQCNKKDS